jgi:hypothetical protein
MSDVVVVVAAKGYLLLLMLRVRDTGPRCPQANGQFVVVVAASTRSQQAYGQLVLLLPQSPGVIRLTVSWCCCCCRHQVSAGLWSVAVVVVVAASTRGPQADGQLSLLMLQAPVVRRLMVSCCSYCFCEHQVSAGVRSVVVVVAASTRCPLVYGLFLSLLLLQAPGARRLTVSCCCCCCKHQVSAGLWSVVGVVVAASTRCPLASDQLLWLLWLQVPGVRWLMVICCCCRCKHQESVGLQSFVVVVGCCCKHQVPAG